MGEPLIKFDYVIVSLTHTCAFYLPDLFLSLSSFKKCVPSHFLSLKMTLGKMDVGRGLRQQYHPFAGA